MRKFVTSCALCAAALAASAQCVSQPTAPAAPHEMQSTVIHVPAAATAAAKPGQAAPGSSMTIAAHAETGMEPGAAAGHHTHDAASGQERRRTGPAMLLAALALMSAIVLRRLGTARL